MTHAIGGRLGWSVRRPAVFVLAMLCLVAVARPHSPNVWAEGTLVADYGFDGSLESTVRGAPALSTVGPTALTTETVDGRERPVLTFEEGSGLTVRLPSETMSPEAYTVAVLFRFEKIESWRRIIDVLQGTSDSGLYTYWGGLQFYPQRAADATVTPNRYAQVVLTRAVDGTVSGYVDGAPQFTFTDANREAVINPDGAIGLFRDDNGVPNEHSAGAVARLRFFNGAMTAGEVAALDRLPD